MSAYVDKIKEIGAGTEIQIYANQFVAGEWVNEAIAGVHDLTIVGATENTSGGPGDSLTHYLDLDGVDDVAWTADHADLRYTGQNHVTWGGFFWIPVTGDATSFDVLFGKGGNAYEFREGSAEDTIRFDPAAGGGILVTGQPTGEWIFYVIRSYASGIDRTELHRRLSADAGVSQIDLTTNTYAEDGHAWKIGARGDDGAFSNFWKGRVAGFFHITGKSISQADMNAIYDAAFESVVSPHVFFDLTDLPADFGNAETATITVRTRGVDIGATPLKLFAQLYQSDESTTLSDEVEVASHASDSAFANSSPVTFTGLNTTANKAVWDAARIRFRWGT